MNTSVPGVSRSLTDRARPSTLLKLAGLASTDQRPAGFLEAVTEKQRRLERRAAELGARIYAERPDAWLARIENYWIAWRAH